MKARTRNCLILEDGTVFHTNDIVEVLYYEKPFKCKIFYIDTSEIIFDCSKEFDSYTRKLKIEDLKFIKLISRKENIYD